MPRWGIGNHSIMNTMTETQSPAVAEFLAIVHDPEAKLSRSLVVTLERECPYFIMPAVEALRRMPDWLANDPEEQKRLKARVALGASDPGAFYDLAGRPAGHEQPEPFYPDTAPAPAPATNDAISTFLETYGHGESSEEDALLERLIFNPQPDYASVLAAEGPVAPAAAADDPHMAAIDAFLAQNGHAPAPVQSVEIKHETPSKPKMAAPPEPDATLSESLAKMFISRGNYSRALEIMLKMDLNNPKKSVYFADQLRFLRMLVAAQQSE